METNKKTNSKKFWNWGKTKNEETEIRTLYLNGVIASEGWFDDDITPALFKDELYAGDGDIDIWINSPGGDCVAASQIYTMLMDYKGAVNVKIDGIAASAASVIAMAGTNVFMSPTSLMMIHNPFTTVSGNTNDMNRGIQMLDEVKEAIINAYELKSNLSRAKISHMMDTETWLSANKAVEYGLADDMLYKNSTNKKADIDDENGSDESAVVSVMFSTRTAENELLSKVVNKAHTQAPVGVPAEQLFARLNLLK